MPLTQLRITGHRGFKNQGSIAFAIPNGSAGSGLTILTGPNNGGKSSILECLGARSGNESASFTAGTRNKNVESVEIIYSVNGDDQIIRSISKGSSETSKIGVTKVPSIFVVPSRKAFNAHFGKAEWNRDQFVDNSPLPPQRSTVLANFEYRLFNILKEPAAFNTILSRVLGYLPVWTIDRSDQGNYFLKCFNGEHSHSSDGTGDGIISVFALVDSLYDSMPGSVIAMDEPELSLHPVLQRRIADLIYEYAKDRQIIVSTHSPYFVNLSALSQGANLARVTTGADGTTIYQLSTASKESIRKLSDGNLYNPHVFGLNARELFFQEDRIIFTEGQEDVLLYPLVAAQVGVQLNGSFFGWGAGGASNIALLCRILADLGFDRVAGLLDGDKAAEASKLAAEFPKFYFACIPAKDIRTKLARSNTNAVEGLLDSKLALKPEHVAAMTALLGALALRMDA